MTLSIEYPTLVFKKILRQLSKNELAEFRNCLPPSNNLQISNIVEACNTYFFENIVIYNQTDFEYLTQNDDEVTECQYVIGNENRYRLKVFSKKNDDYRVENDDEKIMNLDMMLDDNDTQESLIIYKKNDKFIYDVDQSDINPYFHLYEEIYLTFDQVSMIDFNKVKSLRFICLAQHRIFPKCIDSKLLSYNIPHNCLSKNSPGTTWLSLFIKMFSNLYRLQNTCMELQLEFDNPNIKEYYCADKGVSLYQTNVEKIEKLYLNNLYYLKFFNLNNYNFHSLTMLTINECYFFDIIGSSLKSGTLKILRVLNMNDSEKTNNNYLMSNFNSDSKNFENLFDTCFNISGSSGINYVVSNSTNGIISSSSTKNILIMTYSFKDFNSRNLPKLSQLDFINCNIKIIPNISFQKLNRLNLSNNSILVFNNIKCENLSSLDLSNNMINIIGNGLTDLKNLKSLNLSHNNVNDVNFLKNLNKLEDLNLSFNRIQEIKNLDYLKKLKILRLSNNKIDNMGDNFRFKHLEKLYLNNNKIRVVKNLSYAKSLEFLDLSSNKIYKIEQDFEQLKNLKILQLKNNFIKSFSNLHKNASLIELNLDYNELEEIDCQLDYPVLLHFTLSHNNIYSLKNLNNIENLQYFNLANNPILRIPTIPKNNLKFLNLSNNKIDSIHKLNEIFKNNMNSFFPSFINNNRSSAKNFPKSYEKLLKDAIADLKSIHSFQNLLRIKLLIELPILASILTYECHGKIIY